MVRLRGHYDGRFVVLDDPPPPELATDARVEVELMPTREQLVNEWIDALRRWKAIAAPQNVGGGRTWKREDLYDR